MKQHSVQEAYLKKFEDKCRIWVHEATDMKPRHIPAKKCTMEVDFQNYKLESSQNNNIEKPAIDVIRSLYSGGKLNESQAMKLFAWTELHLIRNEKFRYKPDVNYADEYYSLIEVEEKFANYYNCISTYNCEEGEFFITSDNPILEIFISGIIVRLFVISPKTLVMMSPRSGFPETEISFTEMINSTIYANKYKYVFSHKQELPLDLFEKNATRFKLRNNKPSPKFRYTLKNS
ncbi:hypothetical protein [Shewanella sp. TB7-MNA-CIBAN-0143]|uniref:hypothetical protein n=1 Tax=unclassified Shewanella TaxID=196818 RepID=UPI0033281FB2